MKVSALRELAEKWRRLGKEPQVEDGSPENQHEVAERKGQRRARNACADDVDKLIELLGWEDAEDG